MKSGITSLWDDAPTCRCMGDTTSSDISEVFEGRKDRTEKLQRSLPVAPSPDIAEMSCILDPVCLDEFIFSLCPHAGADCSRHRYEAMADKEGELAYGEAEWKQIKAVDHVALVQMVERVRVKNRLSVA